jgi:glycogen debranching enzyme
LINFDHHICSDFELATSKEWLETNGLGGFASSTIIGCNTRRYHGLLVAALKPPSARTVLFSKLEEDLTLGGITYTLSTNQFHGVIQPAGYRCQQEFRLAPFPTFTYLAGGAILEKEIFMPHGMNAVVIAYRLLQAADEPMLTLRPLVAGRDFHQLIHQGAVPVETETTDGEVIVHFGWGPRLHLYHQGVFSNAPQWSYNFEYAKETERGLDNSEDLYSPGTLALSLKDKWCWLVASADPITPEPEKWREEELARRTALAKRWPGAREELQTLARTADSFMVARSISDETEKEPEGVGGGAPFDSAQDKREPRQAGFTKPAPKLWDIVAGYHWFEEWGRDAMISLPGLCITLGEYEKAFGVLSTYAQFCRDGLLPNRFVDADGHADYNTVDSALWFVNALFVLHEAAPEALRGRLRESLLPTAQQIVEHYAAGTHFGIQADADGLIKIGAEGSQTTWMDAKVGDAVMTPRNGKPVEIQALWYNALRILEKLGDQRWNELANQAKASFAPLFWNEPKGCLYDCITDDGPDPAIRPNQVMACSLPFPMLDDDLGRRVLETVERELLTPYGLRTLSPRDARYRGRYAGDVWARDSAYHQGTVWAWLMGPFISAYVRIHGNSAEAKARAKELLEPLLQHLKDAGVGTISEIFDGDPPHTPRGCISQAWSVAEVLRVYQALK